MIAAERIREYIMCMSVEIPRGRHLTRFRNLGK